MRIDDAVLNVLDAAEMSGPELRLTGQLDRKLYMKTNEVLEAAGGKWNRKAKAHIFPSDARELMESIILTGEVSKTKSEDKLMGYFPTPRPIAERLVELAEYPDSEDSGLTTLEPSAGSGALLEVIPWDFCSTAVEINEDRAKEIKQKFPAWFVECADFLQWQPTGNVPERFDRVVMNPPFAKQDDIKHVNHALRFLAPDGVLVAVMSAGVMFRENKLTTEFRALVESRGGEFEEILDGAFKESGTMVRTVIVRIPGE